MPVPKHPAVEQNEAATKLQAAVRGRNSRGDPNAAWKKEPSALEKAASSTLNAFNTMGSSIADATKETLTTLGIQKPRKLPPTDSQVEAATPADRWFTPEHGWRCKNAAGEQPHVVAPTVATAAELFHQELADQSIGELRVEVLEAVGLPNTDALIGNMKVMASDGF